MTILRPYQLDDLKNYIELLETSFPLHERRSTNVWKEYLNNGLTKAQTIIDANNNFQGFITYWNISHFIYIEHFAISPALRNRGIGRKAIQLFLNIYKGYPILLEVEPSESSAYALKRIHFYQSLNFSIIKFNYNQPPYRKDETPTPMLLMSNSCELSSNIEETVSQLIDSVYK